jgi:hypothetical protein
VPGWQVHNCPFFYNASMQPDSGEPRSDLDKMIVEGIKSSMRWLDLDPARALVNFSKPDVTHPVSSLLQGMPRSIFIC